MSESRIHFPTPSTLWKPAKQSPSDSALTITISPGNLAKRDCLNFSASFRIPRGSDMDARILHFSRKVRSKCIRAPRSGNSSLTGSVQNFLLRTSDASLLLLYGFVTCPRKLKLVAQLRASSATRTASATSAAISSRLASQQSSSATAMALALTVAEKACQSVLI